MERSSLRQGRLRDLRRSECRASVERAFGEQCDVPELLALPQAVEPRLRDELAKREIAVVSETARAQERAYEEAKNERWPLARIGGFDRVKVERRLARRARSRSHAA